MLPLPAFHLRVHHVLRKPHKLTHSLVKCLLPFRFLSWCRGMRKTRGHGCGAATPRCAGYPQPHAESHDTAPHHQVSKKLDCSLHVLHSALPAVYATIHLPSRQIEACCWVFDKFEHQSCIATQCQTHRWYLLSDLLLALSNWASLKRFQAVTVMSTSGNVATTPPNAICVSSHSWHETLHMLVISMVSQSCVVSQWQRA